MITKKKSKKPRGERAIVIPGAAIKDYVRRKDIAQATLAELVGVNPATMSRWGGKGEDAPTSTMLLVLIPLLLSAEVDLMPEYYRKAVTAEFESVFDAKEFKRNASKIEKLAQERFWRTNGDIQRARKLFNALREAWDILDAKHAPK